jgi:hypothetical protein
MFFAIAKQALADDLLNVCVQQELFLISVTDGS